MARSEDVQMLVSMMSAKFGEGAVARACDAKALLVKKRFCTGSDALDIALGGGWMEGRVNELAGQFSAGKTTLSTISAGHFILEDFDNSSVLWVDAEKAFDPCWAKRVLRQAGLDKAYRKFTIASPACGEDAVDMVYDAGDKVSRNHRLLVVLDSLAALTPKYEMEHDSEKKGVGMSPRLISQLLRKTTTLLNRNLLSPKPQFTLIALNQVRVNIGVMYGDPETVPGGKALEHMTAVRVRLRRKESIKEELAIAGEKMQNAVGTRIQFTVWKDKTGGSVYHDKGFFTFYDRPYEGTPGAAIDNPGDILPLALMYGVVHRKKRTLVYRADDGTLKFGSDKAYRCYMRQHGDVFSKIKSEVATEHRRVMWREEAKSEAAFG